MNFLPINRPDVKTDDGRISCDTDIAEVLEIDSTYRYIRDIDALMDKLYEHNIYPIARIVTFKDNYLAKNKTEYAIKNQDGSLWKYKNIAWLNPFNNKSWDYMANIASTAVLDGFKEVQFDYIRFEATSRLKNASFGGYDKDKTRKDAVLEYIDFINKKVKPLGAKISADVFGTIITSELDAKNLGQDYLKMAENIDVICPMIYPSHYGRGFYDIPKGAYPDLYPYNIVKGFMTDSAELLATSEKDKVAIVRPWLQAFTASYLGTGKYKPYGRKELREQIVATYETGLDEWILWHAGVHYDRNWLLTDVEAEKELKKIRNNQASK